MVNGAVALFDPVFLEAGKLELAVDVEVNTKYPLFLPADLQELPESFVRIVRR